MDSTGHHSIIKQDVSLLPVIVVVVFDDDDNDDYFVSL